MVLFDDLLMDTYEYVDETDFEDLTCLFEREYGLSDRCFLILQDSRYFENSCVHFFKDTQSGKEYVITLRNSFPNTKCLLEELTSKNVLTP